MLGYSKHQTHLGLRRYSQYFGYFIHFYIFFVAVVGNGNGKINDFVSLF